MLNVKQIQKMAVAFMVTLAIVFAYVPSASAWNKNDTSQEDLRRYASHALYGIWTDGESSYRFESSDMKIVYVFYVQPDMTAYFEVRNPDVGGAYLFRTYRDDNNSLCADVTNQNTGEKIQLVKTDG